jgi:hypothetical protein
MLAESLKHSNDVRMFVTKAFISTFISPPDFNLNVPPTNRTADGTDIPLQNPNHLVAQ